MVSKELFEKMKEWRRHMHAHPEAAFEEVETAKLVASELKKMGYDVVEGVGKTGVVASLTVGDGKKAIGLRADMDSLKMNETTGLPYASQVENRFHGCGHDGHTATLLGAAQVIADRKNFNGTVRLIFQPAEEPGYGARAMIEDGIMERFPMDEVYALHNSPQLPLGQIGTCPGGIATSEDNFVIKIKGKGGHASAPHNVKDPLVIASEIILALQTIVSRNFSPLETAVVSCTEFFTDGARNAIPTNVMIKGDARAYKPESQRLIEERMRKICLGICAMNDAECEFEYTHEFAPTYNDATCTAYAVESAKKVVGEENAFDNLSPGTGSEDFGLFLQYAPGCYLRIGGMVVEDENDAVPVHNSMFDFNDDIMPIGAAFFTQIIEDRMPAKAQG